MGQDIASIKSGPPRMRRMVAVFAAFLFCFACALTWAGQTSSRIEGTVRDPNGHPIAGANISFRSKNSSASVTTNDQGQFLLRDVQASSGTISVQARGFEAQRRSWKGTNNASLVIVLRVARISQQVTVTANRVATPVSQTAGTVAVLTSQRIADTSALSLDGILRQIPGFTLFRRSDSWVANPTTQGVSLRGVGASGASRALV